MTKIQINYKTHQEKQYNEVIDYVKYLLDVRNPDAVAIDFQGRDLTWPQMLSELEQKTEAGEFIYGVFRKFLDETQEREQVKTPRTIKPKKVKA